MAELQQSVVMGQDTRLQIQTQILQWEENLERLHCEQFRLRCYMASLQSGELPNPKVNGRDRGFWPPKITLHICRLMHLIVNYSNFDGIAVNLLQLYKYDAH